MRSAVPLLALGLALCAVAAPRADYEDPWGLPSGTATLKLASQEAITGGEIVHGFDFATGDVDSSGSYQDLVMGGLADLVYFELHPDSSRYFFRAPEDILFFDRYLIFGLEDSLDLDEIASVEGVELNRFEPVEDGFAFVLFQVQTGALPETTAVKLALSALADSSVTFDWVLQPNGSYDFIPTAAGKSSFSALKALYR